MSFVFNYNKCYFSYLNFVHVLNLFYNIIINVVFMFNFVSCLIMFHYLNRPVFICFLYLNCFVLIFVLYRVMSVSC